MRNKSWKFIAALSAVIVLVSVVGSYDVEADGSRLVYVESDGYLLPSGFTSRSDVDFRHSFKRGFSARIGPRALKELSQMDGVVISDVPMLYPSVVPADQFPYGVEQIYDDPNITATSGGAGITIAHLDTGVFTGHPDLVNRIVGCLDATNGMANGCTDDDGHGTHTAGTAVADGGDGTGVYGVAPEAGLFVIKVCNPGCAADDVAVAISYIGDNSLADIVTMSFGGNTEFGLISDAMASYPDILFVAASGNDGPKTGSIDFPARDVNVIAVGAIDASLSVPSFSSRGFDDGDDNVITVGELEYAAAGVSVISTFNDGGYRSGTGTSMSTPHIAGLAAREWQGDAASTRAYLRGGVEDILLATGGGAATGFDVASGYGLPHVSAAAPPPPPAATLDS
ncbi:MAG: S8 family serine peptidase, partial [Chloroflexi bacterium]|nr:S8 family serine peptidase [Chloroflexota bacterium]